MKKPLTLVAIFLFSGMLVCLLGILGLLRGLQYSSKFYLHLFQHRFLAKHVSYLDVTCLSTSAGPCMITQKQKGGLKLLPIPDQRCPTQQLSHLCFLQPGVTALGSHLHRTAGGSGRAMEQFVLWLEESVRLMFARAQEIASKYKSC